MIPEVFIESWQKTVPCRMTEQIEQDLMSSPALPLVVDNVISRLP